MKKIKISRGFFKHSYHLTLNQKKILYWLLANRPKEQFEYWCSIDGFYKTIRSFFNPNRNVMSFKFNFCGESVYKQLLRKSRNMYVEFEQQFLDYISNGEHITRLILEDILKIKSIAVLNLYELLMSYKRYKEITISIEILKRITQCDKYNNYNFMMCFRKWCITLKELIDFEYKVNNHSGVKLIKSITFKINRSK